MLIAETFEYSLRSVALLAMNCPVLNQNTLDDIREGVQLRALWWLPPPVTRRDRMRQDLGHCLTVDPKPTGRFPTAQSIAMTRQPNTPIKIHSVHPPPSVKSILTKAIDGPILDRRNRKTRSLQWGSIAPPFTPLYEFGCALMSR